MKKGILALVLLFVPSIAGAQVRQVRSSSSSGGSQTINFTLGFFGLKSLDSRVTDDVLAADLLNDQPLLFNVSDFNGAMVGGEYLLRVVPHVEAGAGVGYFQHTVPSVYANVTHSSGDEIMQDLKLRMVPVSFTARFLPFDRDAAIQPYVGAGVVAIKWRYSESGEFVDAASDIFSQVYVANGTAVGPTVLAGVRAPIGPALIGGEFRWQRAEGKGLLNQGFLGDKIDLGGWTGNFTFGWRF
jgi:hypothetical protein